MHLKMFYRSFKKKIGVFSLQQNLHHWCQFTKTIFYRYLTKRSQQIVFNLSVNESIKVSNTCTGE